MASLNTYLQQCQRFIRDANQKLIDPADLVEYINRARREVAMRAQCIRVLPPTSNGLSSISIANPGTGYTNPTIEITIPDYPAGTAPFPQGAQATATATLTSGSISLVDLTLGGAGYFQPQVTVTDPTGAGAALVPVLPFINVTNAGQEVYNFKDISLQNFPGVKEILAVLSVSIIYANYRYSLPCYSFTTYQAFIRQYPFQYEYVPTIYSQYGQGANGSLYLYPLPSQEYQMDWDCVCLPMDLESNLDIEAIPDPWTDAVPFFAAYLAYLELQQFNTARNYLEQFNLFLREHSVASRPGRMVNPYGRY